MKLSYDEYRPRRVVNVHKHVDGPWFWGKYSAHPYVGCRSDCAFCYSRGSRYLGRRDPEAFATVIRVKMNAVELLRKELSVLPRDVIACGDWQQPAEGHYRLSRAMLRVLCDLGYPLFIVERSPLLVRDIDLLVEISRQAWVGVLFSISSLDAKLKHAFEPRSPGMRRRLQAMARLATAGLIVGTAMMPVIPCVGDDEHHLDELVRATKDHGGVCVLGGGLTMDGYQGTHTLDAARQFDPELETRWRDMYRSQGPGKPEHSPPQAYSARLGLLVRELCARHGLLDRLPRYIETGPLAANKRIAERLFLRAYDLELDLAASSRIWAYRKAAWTVDEWPTSVSELYQREGLLGLRSLPCIGLSLSGLIATWLQEVDAA